MSSFDNLPVTGGGAVVESTEDNAILNDGTNQFTQGAGNPRRWFIQKHGRTVFAQVAVGWTSKGAAVGAINLPMPTSEPQAAFSHIPAGMSVITSSNGVIALNDAYQVTIEFDFTTPGELRFFRNDVSIGIQPFGVLDNTMFGSTGQVSVAIQYLGV